MESAIGPECRPCPLDNCPIMLRASLQATVEILPQARQGSYFFNRQLSAKEFRLTRGLLFFMHQQRIRCPYWMGGQRVTTGQRGTEELLVPRMPKRPVFGR